MTPRISFAIIAALVLAETASGCLTREAAHDAGEGGGPGRVPSRTEDASTDVLITSITVPDDAGVDALDPGAGGATADSGTEQPNLPAAPLSDVGVSCAVNAQCATGSCVDGVCCSSAACGGCQSCAVPGSVGACSPLPKLTEDPRSSCVGTMACDGAGHCAEANGNSCPSSSACLSGFCVDGVCCESACDETCFACNTTLELRGKCQPLASGTDLNAAAPCGGNNSCVPGPTPDQPLCLLNDGQPCTTAAECVSGQCSKFYADRDGDKFGNPDSSISICGAPDAPPTGYVVTAGDCCDADGNAHPNQFSSFTHPDACGSWDYNCDGVVEEQFTTGPCGGYPAGAAADCGKTCVGFVLGASIVRYTQACR